LGTCPIGFSPGSPTSSRFARTIRCPRKPPGRGESAATIGSGGTGSIREGPTDRRFSANFRPLGNESFKASFLASSWRISTAAAARACSSARSVAENLRHFDGERYRLSEFVVMPNHVHLLVCLLGQTDLEKQCYSWKKYTATQINRVLGERGRFWHEESFDHLVRSPEEFEHLRRYIVENPQQARLQEGEYLLWRCSEPP
jgi:REP element-mobilizing transposase RayT